MAKGFLWLNILSLLFIFSCNSGGNALEGNGILVEDTRSLEPFSAIEIEGNYTLELVQGDPGITIKADSNLLSYIQTEVNGNTLVLKNTKEIEGTEEIIIKLSYPELEKLEIGGAGTVSHQGILTTDELEIDVNGAALLELELAVKNKLDLELSGASSITLTGSAPQLEADLSGAGNLEAYELRVRDASINLSGVGGAEVFVTDNLQAKVSGVGGISYKGKPRNIQQEVSGVGFIKPADAGDDSTL